MELRKRPRKPRVDPDFVSSPPPQLLRKRARKQSSAKRPREAAGVEKQQRSRKRARCARLGVGSPVAGLHPARCFFQQVWTLPPTNTTRVLPPRDPFNWYEPDMWTEIAKHLCGHDLVCLSLTCHWFHRLLADDSIWRHAFIRDLLIPVTYVPPPRPLDRSWHRLYAAAFADGSHSYCYYQSDKHIDGLRMGGLLLETPYVLLAGKLPLPRWVPEEAKLAIEMTGACVLRDARPGIWIADRHLLRCLACNVNDCTGTVQVLDVRHSELFLEEYCDGTWEYEDLGEHFMDEEAAAACCAVFNRNRLGSTYANFVRDTKSWIRKRQDWRPKACVTPYAVAINSNLNENGGLLSKFQAMRDVTGDGQVVSIRITQQLI